MANKIVKHALENDLIKELLSKSSRAASGGNLQPWKIFIINNIHE